MLQSEKLLASIGLDIDDNEPSKISLKLNNPGGYQGQSAWQTALDHGPGAYTSQ